MAQSGRPRKCDPKVDALRQDIKYDQLDTVTQTLAEFGVDATDAYGRTALINAVIENKEDLIRWLLENGANINHQDRGRYSVLHFTAQERFVDLTRLLLEVGANPNLQDKHGNTALWTAIMNEKLPPHEQAIVKLLLEFGADPDITNNYGKSPRDLYTTMYALGILAIE
ncbi:ankyrin repeat domain-containing protein [Hymenobacter cavernae]|uniref:Ankyrin repeat domain-containing protein n=1 Tax=Hymenobacter cavernae TaxID=2044852 RepID=A0ABQ1U149_9BACT|nr:ankyrin repeat domain-containing protein [Hymenobacter cavernae]GGF06738.1 hypothetical protein GCM10011383_17220 [Hymenobacter cavernae]